MVSYFKKNHVKEITFIPYALKDYDTYTKKVADIFSEWGYETRGIHTYPDPVTAIKEAKCIFIGGGNTFVLLRTLYDHGLVELIRKRVIEDGVPYLGSSAGTNVAALSINTTNDMPIAHSPSFEALALVPFHINPHYLDTPDSDQHQGETREERILQFIEHNNKLVLALREGTCLLVDGDKAKLIGPSKSRLFYPDKEPIELDANSDISFLF